jgi:hypothetical protein
MVGCESESYQTFEETQVQIERSDVYFTSAGGTGAIVVAAAEQSVTATSDQSWCKVALSGNTITVTVEPNKNIMGRTALVTINAQDKVNYVPVTQTSVTLTLDTYAWDASPKGATIEIAYNCAFQVSIANSSIPDWITASINEATKKVTLSATQNQSFLDSRTATVQLYVDGENGIKMALKEIIITQAKNFLNYEDYLGEYTMRYTTTAGTVATPTKSLDVTFVTGVKGSTYFLKGILINESAGNIVANYESATGNVTLLGQVIGKTVPNGWDFWWLPYSYANATPTSFYTSRTTTYGMRSVDIEISGNLKFGMKDIGAWTNYTLFGFILRNYDGSTSQGNVNGNGSDYRYYYPTFEKK